MSDVYTPTTDADDLFKGDGSWRPLMSEAVRDAGWKLHMIGKSSIENKTRGILLPSFDWSMPLHDESFMRVVAPCWTQNAAQHSPRHFTPNAWGIAVSLYPFLGESKEHWFSPHNRLKMIGGDQIDPSEASDAFDDLNKWVRKTYRNDEGRREYYLKAPSMSESALVPGRTARFVSLAETMDKENTWHKTIIMYTGAAHSYLVEQMRWPHLDKSPARDPNFPQYMLGDPTDPKGAMVWHVDKMMVDPRDLGETNVICFTERREYLDSQQQLRPVSQEMIDARFRLPDPANWNFPTYEEQVRYMMESYAPEVTADMIRAACGYRCREDIPRERPASVRVDSRPADDRGQSQRDDRRDRRQQDGGARDEDPMKAVTGGFKPSSAPPMPHKSVEQHAGNEQTQRAAAPQALSVKYWIGKPREQPFMQTVEQLQALVDNNEHEAYMLCLDGKSDWRTIIDSGLVVVRPPAFVAAEDDRPTAFVPADDRPTAFVPADDAAPVAAGEMTREAFVLKLFPNFPSLEGDKLERANGIVERAWVATARGTRREMPADIVRDLMAELG